MKPRVILSAFAMAASTAIRLAAAPLGTTFTYQGQLTDGGQPANGTYQLQLKLFDRLLMGSQVGTTLSSIVGVTNGLFTTTLNFGGGVFTGDARWLEIGVRTNGSASDHVLLSPRQPLTPTPYALFSPQAGTVNNAGVSAPALNTPSPPAAGQVLAYNGSTLAWTNGGAIAGAWLLGGNAGTTPGTDFLGTTDNQPLEFKINGLRAGRLELTGDSSEDFDTAPDGAPNVILGAPINFLGAGAVGATIAGGGATNFQGFAYSNSVLASYAAIGGGFGNLIKSAARCATVAGGEMNGIGTNSLHSTIGGGRANKIAENAAEATVAGGLGNYIGKNSSSSVVGGGDNNDLADNSASATIAGGSFNTIGTNSDHSTVGGGQNNAIAANSPFATIPGGQLNSATNYAFAAGRRAKANHQGAFVWGDSSNADITSTNANSVTLRAAGGYRLFSNADATAGVYLAPGGGSWTSLSDRNAKENLEAINARSVLERVATLPLSTWNYKSQDASVRHLGPMAQDFKTAFRVGESDTGITTTDADGVALAAIQGLNQKLEAQVKQKDVEIAELKQAVAELKQVVRQLAK
jgi:hypothetical protein